MAERLIAALCALGAALAGSSASQAALAQALHDPMRPPAASDPSTAEASKDSAARTARLQSVLISPGRRVAVIDGRVVRLGERVGDATLVAISESQVVLQRRGGRETLKLNPVVDKKAARKGAVP